MEITTICDNCKRTYSAETNTRNLRELIYCSDKCNEEYFEKYGNGLVPTKYQNRYIILDTGRARIITEENGICRD